MGMCLSYGRVLEITQKLSNSLINQYNIHGVFAPSVLRKGIFTVIAKDNIDHNATSTTALKHTTMQFVTEEKQGDTREILENSESSLSNRLQMPFSYINIEQTTFKKGENTLSFEDYQYICIRGRINIQARHSRRI